MAGTETVWDQRKFDEALAEYIKVSSRTLTEIVNTKLYFIGRQAIWNTSKADAYQIKQQLGGIISVNRLTKAGKTVRKRQLQLVTSSRTAAPLAALIIQKRFAKRGDPSPFFGRTRAQGIAAMNRLVRQLLGSRMRSLAFIKSGFVPGVKALAPFADKTGQPATDESAKQIGQAKGEAIPAKESFSPEGQLANFASAKRDIRAALSKYGGEGLQIAFDDEAASMLDYMEKKLRPDADAFNRRQDPF